MLVAEKDGELKVIPAGGGPVSVVIDHAAQVNSASDRGLLEQQVLLGNYTSGPCPQASNTLDCIPSDGLSQSIGTVRSAPDGTLWVGSGDAAGWEGLSQSLPLRPAP
jgi:hypothetical protein